MQGSFSLDILTSLTAAGCYLSAAPRSKGTKILVCFHDSPQSSTMPLSQIQPCNKPVLLLGELDQIICELKSCSDQSVPEACNVHFLHAKSSEDVLNEAKRLNLISESTFTSMRLLQMKEQKNFNSKMEGESSCDTRHEKAFSSVSHITLRHGELCYFMSRFLVTWEVCRDALKDEFSWSCKKFYQESAGNQDHLCQFCMIGQVKSITIRHMVDADWLYLAKILQDFQDHGDASVKNLEQNVTGKVKCSSYMQLSAKKALQALKSIPVSARRALPVVVTPHDLLLSIPSIGFSCCPCLLVTAVFKPRVPLGGGYSSYI